MKKTNRPAKRGKSQRAVLILLALLIGVMCITCDSNNSSGTSSGNYKWVEYDLQGTWVRNIEDFWPEGQTDKTEYGKLVMSYDTITITGPVAHMQGFTRNTALGAYTEDGNLFIKDKGVWQTPIAYNKWKADGPYPRDEMLTFTGGGVTDETLKKTE